MSSITWFCTASAGGRSVAGWAGREVTLGIRPEHLAPSTDGRPHMTVTVELVETLGADTLVHGNIGEGASLIGRSVGYSGSE